MASLRSSDIPESPGVCALYRDDSRMYVGKADCLRDRIWKNHSGRGAVMTGSAMRRNVAEHLGIHGPASWPSWGASAAAHSISVASAHDAWAAEQHTLPMATAAATTAARWASGS